MANLGAISKAMPVPTSKASMHTAATAMAPHISVASPLVLTGGGGASGTRAFGFVLA